MTVVQSKECLLGMVDEEETKVKAICVELVYVIAQVFVLLTWKKYARVKYLKNIKIARS